MPHCRRRRGPPGSNSRWKTGRSSWGCDGRPQQGGSGPGLTKVESVRTIRGLYTQAMVWVLAFVAVLVLYFIYISRPGRMVRSTIVLAERTCRKMDWPAAAKYYRVAHAEAGRLKEPLKSQVESELEIQWAGVLYRQGQMGEAEDLLRRGLVKARRHLSPESGFLMQGELYWGDLCTDVGRHGEAEDLLRRGLVKARRHLSPESGFLMQGEL